MIWFDTASLLVHLGCGIVLSKVIRMILSAMVLPRATWILPMREDFVRT